MEIHDHALWTGEQEGIKERNDEEAQRIVRRARKKIRISEKLANYSLAISVIMTFLFLLLDLAAKYWNRITGIQ